MRPQFTIPQILAWADTWHERTGRWPARDSGRIPDSLGEKWSAVDRALYRGLRGLPVGSSLARLLADRRNVRNVQDLPRLTQKQILTWADAHHQRTGRWPVRTSGSITDTPGETWQAIDTALGQGRRRLPGGSSLARLLARRRGVRNKGDLPRLTVEQIHAWAEAHRRRTGSWPNNRSGPVKGVAGLTWLAVDQALRKGRRGLPGGTSLSRLLREPR